MIIPIEAHKLEDILSYEDNAGNKFLNLRNKIFESRPRLVHKYLTYSDTKSTGIFYHRELNRIPRDLDLFFTITINNGADWARFSRLDDL